MEWLKRLVGGNSRPPKQRIRVCVECGQPVERHADWCAILRTQQEMDRRAARTDTGGQ